MKIIIIEDNELLGTNLSMYLKLKNIDNILLQSVEESKIYLLNNEKIDLILLDINLP
jgi:DNA-binding response OmpR family regulator